MRDYSVLNSFITFCIEGYKKFLSVFQVLYTYFYFRVISSEIKSFFVSSKITCYFTFSYNEFQFNSFNINVYRQTKSKNINCFLQLFIIKFIYYQTQFKITIITTKIIEKKSCAVLSCILIFYLQISSKKIRITKKYFYGAVQCIWILFITICGLYLSILIKKKNEQ